MSTPASIDFCVPFREQVVLEQADGRPRRVPGRGTRASHAALLWHDRPIKAIDRFELTREVEFTSFAVPYIVGEIKRFFRDTTWAVHVPRRLQEARVALAKATEEHRSRLGRMPTTRELSALMSLSERDVIEARKAANGYTSTSLDAAIASSEDGEPALADFIGVDVRAASPAPPPHSAPRHCGAQHPVEASVRGDGRCRQGSGLWREASRRSVPDVIGFAERHAEALYRLDQEMFGALPVADPTGRNGGPVMMSPSS
ncbi:sigma-70 domain-containing protein [Streptomyces sp. NPDC058202]|uniref:sigma-70 domain-containing protein n=1 Tax=Streptomyces sp. NPDC058202 TaxID=3346380 RepID=UPI0036F16650